jgi:aspartate 1-decarboxylase
MFLKALKGKIHRARVTGAKIDYSGSVAVDPNLLDAAGIANYESVLVADVNNGNRFETYVVPANRGSGDIIIMGAAARLAKVGDLVILINFAYFAQDELAVHKPRVVIVDEHNKVKEII